MNVNTSRWIVLCFLCSTNPTAISLGEETNANPHLGNVQVHNWYVPAEYLPQVTKGHVPVPAAELAALLDSLQRRPHAKSPITSATYKCRYENGQLTDGRVVCEVAHLDTEPSRERNEFRLRLPLGDCGLAFQASSNDDSVELGTDRFGRPVAILSRRPTFELGWTLANRHPDSSIARYDFVGFPSPFNVLEIDVPSELRLTSSNGIVRSNASTSGAAFTTWEVSLGGFHETRLQVSPRDELRDASPVVATRQVTRYLLSSQGSEIVVEISLDSDRPFTDVTLVASSEIEITRGLFEDNEVTLTPITNEDESSETAPNENGTKAQAYSIHFPQAERRGLLQVFAQVDSPMNGPLPKILPAKLLWEERVIEVGVPDHLELSGLAIDRCRWRNLSRDLDGKTRTLEWQVLADSGNVAFTSRAAAPLVTSRATSQVILKSDQTTGVVNVELVGQSGATYELHGTIHQPWSVDSIVTEPPTALDDWSVESNGSASNLHVRLGVPLAFGHKVQLQLNAQRAKIRPSSLFDGDIANILSWKEVQVVSRVNAFAAESPMRLIVENDDAVAPMETNASSATTATGDHQYDNDYVYDALRAISAPKFRLQRGNIPWSAGVQVQNYFHDAVCDESWEVECLAESDGLNEVTIRVAPGHESNALWFADRQHTIPLAAERIEQTGDDEDLETFDTYRVTISKSSTNEKIFGTRTRSLQLDEPGNIQATVLAIVTAPSAKSHGAIVSIICDEFIAERVQDIRSSLDTISVLRPASFDCLLLAAFRYDANTDFKLPMIVFDDDATTSSPDLTTAWIERATTSTRIAASGQRWHELKLNIQNRGRRAVQIQLPQEATVQRLTVDDKIVAIGSADQPSSVQVPLRFTDEFAVATIEFSDAARALSRCAVIRKPEWSASVPIFTDDWYIELPRRFSTFPAIKTAMGSMGKRLFGPLGKTSQDAAGSRRTVSTSVFVPYESIHVFPNLVFRILRWVTLLTLAGLAWSPRFEPRNLFLLAGLGITFAAAAPSPFFAVGTAMAWGILLGLSLRWLPPPRSAETRIDPHARFGLGVVGFLATLLASAPSTGQTLDGGWSGILHVVVPFESKDLTSGEFNESDVVYVPAERYEQLVRAANERSNASSSVVIEQVTYRTTLQSDSDGLPAESADVIAEFTVRAPPIAAPLSIPVGDGARDRLAAPPTLNEVAFDPVWNDRGDSLVVHCEPNQRSDVRLKLSPVRGSRGNWMSIHLPIHPHPSARLVVDHMTDPQLHVLVPSAFGATSNSSDGQTFSAELGSADSLDLRWREASLSNDTAANQFLHFSISPGMIRLRMLVVSTVDSKPLRQLRFRIPSNVSWTKPTNTDISTQRLGDGMTELFVEWPADDNRPRELEFLMRGAIANNQLKVAIPEAMNLRLDRRLVALKIDKNFSMVQDNSETNAGLDTFYAAWPSAPVADVLKQLGRDQSDFMVTLLPRTSRQVADESSTLMYNRDSVIIHYRAEVAPLEGQTFQHILRVPTGIIIESATISQNQKAHWTRSDDSLVHIRTDQPISGPHELAVTGRLTFSDTNPKPLPLIRFESALVNRSLISILRADDVALQVIDLGSFSPLSETPTGFSAVSDAKPIAILESKGKELIAPTVELQPNEARLRANILTTMQAVGTEWLAHINCLADTEKGVLDSISFEIPDNWGEALSITPDLRWEIYRLPNRRRRLRVWVPVSSENRQQLTLSARIDTGQGVRLPRVRPMFASEVNSWVALPTSIEGRSLEWATRRLVGQALPKELVRGGTGNELQTYRAIGRSAGATLRTTNRSDAQPIVRFMLSDIIIHHKTIQQSFRYFIQPNGQGSLEFRLPDNSSLISVTAAGRNGNLEQTKDNVWKIDHLPTTLPYRLDIRCLTRHSSIGPTIRAESPRLIGCRVQQSIWSARSQVDGLRLQPMPGSRALDHDQRWSSKLDALTELIDLPAEAASSATQAESLEWNRLWTVQLAEEFGADSNSDSHKTAMSLLTNLRDSGANLQARNTWPMDVAVMSTAADSEIAFEAVVRNRSSTARTSLALLAIMLPLWLSKPHIWDTAQRNVHRWLPMMVVGSGFIWTIWLFPSWFGLILVAAGVASSLHPLLARTGR